MCHSSSSDLSVVTHCLWQHPNPAQQQGVFRSLASAWPLSPWVSSHTEYWGFPRIVVACSQPLQVSVCCFCLEKALRSSGLSLQTMLLLRAGLWGRLPALQAAPPQSARWGPEPLSAPQLVRTGVRAGTWWARGIITYSGSFKTPSPAPSLQLGLFCLPHLSDHFLLPAQDFCSVFFQWASMTVNNTCLRVSLTLKFHKGQGPVLLISVCQPLGKAPCTSLTLMVYIPMNELLLPDFRDNFFWHWLVHWSYADRNWKQPLEFSIRHAHVMCSPWNKWSMPTFILLDSRLLTIGAYVLTCLNICTLSFYLLSLVCRISCDPITRTFSEKECRVPLLGETVQLVSLYPLMSFTKLSFKISFPKAIWPGYWRLTFLITSPSPVFLQRPSP